MKLTLMLMLAATCLAAAEPPKVKWHTSKPLDSTVANWTNHDSNGREIIFEFRNIGFQIGSSHVERVATFKFPDPQRNPDGSVKRPESTDAITAEMWTADGTEYKAQWVKVEKTKP